MSSTCRGLWLVVVLACPALGQEQPTPSTPDRGELLARVARFQEQDRALRLGLIRLQAAQDRVLAAEDKLSRLRAGKTEEELQDRDLQAHLRLATGAFEQARLAYERLSRLGAGERAARGQALATEFGALMQGLEALLKQTPDDVELRLVRGELYAGKGRFLDARPDAEAVILERPTDPRALILLGKCLIPENRFQEALGLFQLAQEQGASDLTHCYCALANYCLNDFPAALADREAIADVSALPPELQLRCAWWLEPARLRALSAAWQAELARRAREEERGDLPQVELSTTRGPILLELFEDQAPNTCAAFLQLVEQGFYDGLAWHRVVPDLLAQTGDPSSREGGSPEGLRGGPGFRLPDEDNDRLHFRGTLSLARTRGGQDSGGSQIFLTVIPAPRLDGGSTVFGRVVQGLKVLDRLTQADRIEHARVVRPRRRQDPVRTLPVPQGPPPGEGR